MSTHKTDIMLNLLGLLANRVLEHSADNNTEKVRDYVHQMLDIMTAQAQHIDNLEAALKEK